MTEYKTRCEVAGLRLQVAKVGSSNYVQVVQTIEPLVIIARWSSAPYVGKMRDLYRRFDKIVSALPKVGEGNSLCILAAAKTENLNDAHREAIEQVKKLLMRYDAVAYMLPADVARQQQEGAEDALL